MYYATNICMNVKDTYLDFDGLYVQMKSLGLETEVSNVE